MTNADNSIEEGIVDVPEAEDIDEGRAGQQSRRTMSTTLKLILIAAGLMVFIIGGIVWSVNNEVVETRLNDTPDLDTTPGGINQQESERYRGFTEESNDLGADRAIDRGATFVPTPEAIMRPAEVMEERQAIEIEQEAPEEEAPVERVVAVPPAPPVIERTPVPAPPPRQQVPEQSNQQAVNGEPQQPVENPYTEIIRQQMGSIASSYTPRISIMGKGDPVETEADRRRAREDADRAAGKSDTEMASNDYILRPGDILYGETLTSVNSDANSPVLVELTTGEFKGARLVGTFDKPNGSDRLVVQFSRMTLEDGTTIGINGFAVDGKTAETAVASDVERRYVARYLPIFASTFVAGFANAASQPAQTVSDNGNGVTVATEQSTTEEAALSGLAAASSVIASDIMDQAPKGPKISLRDGYPIAIMIMDPATIEEPVAQTMNVRQGGLGNQIVQEDLISTEEPVQSGSRSVSVEN